MIKKGDFVEVDFTARLTDTGRIFDTTSPAEAKRAGLEGKGKLEPARACVGQRMLIAGLDEALEGKEEGKRYRAELEPSKAFGERDSKLVRPIPLRVFREKSITPRPGMLFNLDNMLVRIAAVSGGRVIADFNSPLAGKRVEYEFAIKRRITDKREKLLVLAGHFLGLEQADLQLEQKEGKFIATISNKAKKLLLRNARLVELFKEKAKQLASVDVELR